MANTPSSIFFSVLGILLAGGLGAFFGWALIGWLGLAGLAGAFVAALVAMVVAVAVWIGLTVALRSLRLLR